MEKTWLKHYPAGVPAEIDVAQYKSLVELIDESFKKYRDASAYKFMGKSSQLRPGRRPVARRSPPTCKALGSRTAIASRS